MGYAKRVDANQSDVIKALQEIGAKVTDLSRNGGGVPDLLVFYRGLTMLLEIKVPGGKLNPLQVKWHAEHEGYMVYVVRSVEEAIAAVTNAEG